MNAYRKFPACFIIIMMAAALWSCTSGDEPENPSDNKPLRLSLSTEQKEIVASSNQFAIELLKTVSKTSGDNQAISPISMGYLLSMLANGASGNTLDEFLTLCATADIEIMNIELKTPLSGEKGIVKETLAAVKEHGLFDKLLISSFSPELLVECKRLDPACKTGFLYSPDRKITYKKMLFGYVEFAKEIGAEYLHPHFSLVNKHYVKKLHDNGIGINVWTVDGDGIAKRMLDCGVDGIITNVPDMINALVERY